MHQVIQQTDEEKKALYMELSKEKLAEMLVQCNKIINQRINTFGASTDIAYPVPPSDVRDKIG
jgi:hypothetical protein